MMLLQVRETAARAHEPGVVSRQRKEQVKRPARSLVRIHAADFDPPDYLVEVLAVSVAADGSG